MSKHLDIPASQEILAQWVSLALRRALTPSNIQAGFSATGIYPLNHRAVDKLFTPGEAYSHCRDEGNGPSAVGVAESGPARVEEDSVEAPADGTAAYVEQMVEAAPADVEAATRAAHADVEAAWDVEAADRRQVDLDQGRAATEPVNQHVDQLNNVAVGISNYSIQGVGHEPDRRDPAPDPIHSRDRISESIIRRVHFNERDADSYLPSVDEAGHVGADQTCDLEAAAELYTELNQAPSASTSHFFVGNDDSYVVPEEDIATLDLATEEAQSITRFLELPKVTARTSGRRKDPIVEFAKSVIITSHEYIEAANALKESREKDKKEKELAKQTREETRKRKAVEREEERARKSVEREALLRQKEERAAQRAATQARKAADKEIAQRTKVARAQQIQFEKLARATERARVTAERVKARRSRPTHMSPAPEPPFVPHQLPPHLFFSPSANIPQFSQSGVHAQSALPSLQLQTNYRVPAIPLQTNHPWYRSTGTEERR
ncbi:hypothetical protein KC19_VG277500 [Ceratodon purpureus]|uniref:Uncharacterized protein n=1 Tax=Ceratodon purpureus TaxID=3225 RepID=A0A8T0HV95_CERPU|nr:hypothetical protein KC19_VG277500 [Ceratodon purpureus]